MATLGLADTVVANDQGSVRAFARLAIQEGFYFSFCCAAFSTSWRGIFEWFFTFVAWCFFLS